MKQRIITAVIALIIVAPFLVYGGWPFVLFGFILATIGLYELITMRKLGQFAVPGILSVLLLWVMMARFEGGMLPYVSMTKLEGAGFFVLLLLAYTVIAKNRFTFEDAGFLAISAIYVGMGFYYLIEARIDGGLDILFFIFFIIWATDSGAYFVGRSLGKRKLWPVISPNKTIEGAIGGVLIALVVAIVFQLVHPLDFSMAAIIFIALLISIAGQIGDLVQSAFKRHYGVKDSGKIMPGHGGILDRLDSMMFVLPFLHFIQFIH